MRALDAMTFPDQLIRRLTPTHFVGTRVTIAITISRHNGTAAKQTTSLWLCIVFYHHVHRTVAEFDQLFHQSFGPTVSFGFLF
jgi:hypothetical protein